MERINQSRDRDQEIICSFQNQLLSKVLLEESGTQTNRGTEHLERPGTHINMGTEHVEKPHEEEQIKYNLSGWKWFGP